MQFAEQVAARQSALLAAVPYAALPGLAPDAVFEQFVWQRLQEFAGRPGHFIWSAGVGEQQVVFLYRHLPWDTAFFGRAMARLQAVVFGLAVRLPELTAAVQQFSRHLAATSQQHCYCEVATPDVVLLAALGRAGWATVETRLHYYHTLHSIPATRNPVRKATAEDAEAVRRVAATNRNPADRFHADPFFTPEQGDAFLGEYAAATVLGYTDLVLVPQQEPLDSFLAISYLAPDARQLGCRLGRVVLAAVGARNQGWHRPLLSETLWHLQQRGSRYALLTTQAANRAVIHNCEVLGFRLGGLTHMLSWQAR
ncbi:hypothetical protein K3G63_16965 [Hymenobacter sp. HSC-4F20]|uniref:hypothetical protein n=1 Tax=Hymenobacter sp. HSC-4F20 TaxID=2864135 RepID=UPI001C737FA5|nr:hypothetical protein [Hymenobacter sp. HSC-4F20]MBX0292143.1 hypothetical protein [Hymenobacter sp. HSC-4F20]